MVFLLVSSRTLKGGVPTHKWFSFWFHLTPEQGQPNLLQEVEETASSVGCYRCELRSERPVLRLELRYDSGAREEMLWFILPRDVRTGQLVANF